MEATSIFLTTHELGLFKKYKIKVDEKTDYKNQELQSASDRQAMRLSLPQLPFKFVRTHASHTTLNIFLLRPLYHHDF